jgi:hypothetical protein
MQMGMWELGQGLHSTDWMWLEISRSQAMSSLPVVRQGHTCIRTVDLFWLLDNHAKGFPVFSSAAIRRTWEQQKWQRRCFLANESLYVPKPTGRARELVRFRIVFVPVRAPEPKWVGGSSPAAFRNASRKRLDLVPFWVLYSLQPRRIVTALRKLNSKGAVKSMTEDKL